MTFINYYIFYIFYISIYIYFIDLFMCYFKFRLPHRLHYAPCVTCFLILCIQIVLLCIIIIIIIIIIMQKLQRDLRLDVSKSS